MESAVKLSQKDVFYIIVLLLFIAIFWNVKKGNMGSHTAVQSATVAKSTAQAPSRNPAIAGEPLKKQQNLAQSIQLQNQLVIERQNLEQIQNNLNLLKARQIQEQQQLQLSYPARASQNTNEIQNLSEILQEHRRAENDVTEDVQSSVRDQASNAQLAKDQIEFEIQTAQENLQQTLAQINYWQSNFLLTPEQQTVLNDLQNQFIDQRNQLDLLRQQRVNISASVLAQTRMINEVARQTKEQILSSEAEIQDRITALQNELIQLEQAQDQIRVSSKTLDTQIAETQKTYDLQVERIRNMENTLKSLN